MISLEPPNSRMKWGITPGAFRTLFFLVIGITALFFLKNLPFLTYDLKKEEFKLDISIDTGADTRTGSMYFSILSCKSRTIFGDTDNQAVNGYFSLINLPKKRKVLFLLRSNDDNILSFFTAPSSSYRGSRKFELFDRTSSSNANVSGAVDDSVDSVFRGMPIAILIDGKKYKILRTNYLKRSNGNIFNITNITLNRISYTPDISGLEDQYRAILSQYSSVLSKHSNDNLKDVQVRLSDFKISNKNVSGDVSRCADILDSIRAY